MSSSFVELRGRGIWVNDVLLREFARGIAEMVDRLPGSEPWMFDARDHWHREAEQVQGWICLELDRFATTPERSENLARLVNCAMGRLERLVTPPHPLGWLEDVYWALLELLSDAKESTARTSPVYPRHPLFQVWPAEDHEQAMIWQYWIYLERERFRLEPGESTIDRLLVPSWESKDPRVMAAWEALTRPSHLAALERWYRPAEMNPEAKAATEAALKECRARAGN